MAEAITIARPYAVAIFKLAKEKKALAQWSDELSLIAAVVADARVSAMIDDPKLSAEELEKTLLAIFKGKLSETANNLVKLLVENNRLGIVADIVAAFETLNPFGNRRLTQMNLPTNFGMRHTRIFLQ